MSLFCMSNQPGADQDQVTLRLAPSVLLAKPRLRAFTGVDIPELVQDVLFSRDRDEIQKAMAIAADCLGHALDAGAKGADLVPYWLGIVQAQYELSKHWIPPEPPSLEPKKRGRPKGHRDISNDDLLCRMLNGKSKWFRDHPAPRR